MNKTVSPSRTYVAICNKTNFDGYYFRKFVIPPEIKENDSEFAAWWFLNRLNFTACIDGCYTFEDFSNLKTVMSNGKIYRLAASKRPHDGEYCVKVYDDLTGEVMFQECSYMWGYIHMLLIEFGLEKEFEAKFPPYD